MKKLLIFGALLLGMALQASAQNSFYSNTAMRFNTGFPAYPASGAVITVCSASAIGLPCAPQANVCSSSTDTLCQGLNPFNADGNGNFGFWAQPGIYIVTITGASVNGYTLTVSIPLSFGSSGTFTGNLSFTGNLTFSGTNVHNGVETFNNSFITNTLSVTGLNGCVQAGAGGLFTSTGAACGSSGGSVTVTGSPGAGNLTVFSSGSSVTNGDLSGDVTTAGSAATTVNAVNGVTYPTNPAVNTVPIVTALGVVTYVPLPNCNPLAYNTTTFSFFCGTPPPSLRNFLTRNLSSPVTTPSNTLNTIDGLSVTMPVSGGPFRVRINYWYYLVNGGNFACYATDVISGIEVHGFAGYTAYPNNAKGGCNSSGVSPTTYANGQVVTFRTKMFTGGTNTVQVTNALGGLPSSMQVEVFASN